MIRTISRYLFPIYLMVMLFLLVRKPSTSSPEFNLGFWGIPPDKVGHTILFLPYMVLQYYCERKQHFVILLFFGIFVCSLAESLHYFLPYREFSVYDYMANLVGLSLGSLIFAVGLRRTKF